MTEEEVVVARIVGRELQVERYEFRQRSVSSVICAEGELEEQIRRLRPHLVMWSAPDARGRRLADELQKSDPETEWRPGCVELAGWTHLPFSELLRLMCHVGQNEGGWPPDAQGVEAEAAEREDLAEIRHEEQARQAEAAEAAEVEQAVSAAAEGAAEVEQAVSAEAVEDAEVEQAVSAEAVEAAEVEQGVSAEAGDVSAEAVEAAEVEQAVSAEAGDVSGEAVEKEAGLEQAGDELGQRLELVLAVRARLRDAGRGEGRPRQ